MLKCSTCQEEKPKSEYYKNRSKSGRNGLTWECKACNCARMAAWRKNNPEKHKESLRKWYKKNQKRAREYRLGKEYGITLEEYADAVERQGGKCACCKKKPPRGKILCVDHCHTTGAVRGLLCSACNVGIGSLGDDLNGVLNAVSYLRKAKS